MKNFYLHNNRVDIVRNDNSLLTIYFNEYSGKVYYRYKIDTISKVKHPGIYLGQDYLGKHYYMHNHFENGKPAIDNAIKFMKGRNIIPYEETFINSPLQLIENGLNEIMRGERYDKLTYNCQTFVHTAGNNIRKSESVENWAKGLFFGSLALLFIGAVASGGK